MANDLRAFDPSINLPTVRNKSSHTNNEYIVCESSNWFWAFFVLSWTLQMPVLAVSSSPSVPVGCVCTRIRESPGAHHTRIKRITKTNFVNEFKLYFHNACTLYRLTSIPCLMLSLISCRLYSSFAPLPVRFDVSPALSVLFCLVGFYKNPKGILHCLALSDISEDESNHKNNNNGWMRASKRLTTDRTKIISLISIYI